jgi:Tfp pilus assembly protein PilF
MQFALAWAYEKLGNMDKALDNYRQVLTKDPNHVRALTHSGAILYRLGERFQKQKDTSRKQLK